MILGRGDEGPAPDGLVGIGAHPQVRPVDVEWVLAGVVRIDSFDGLAPQVAARWAAAYAVAADGRA